MSKLLLLFNDFTLSGLSALDLLLIFLLIFTRWLVMTSTIPYLGAALLPSLVRIALAGVLSAVSFALVFDTIKAPLNLDIFIIGALFFKEALIGFILGFLASLIFFVYELIGEILDFARAASMLRILVPQIKYPSSSMGALLFQLSLTLFFALGFHRNTTLALLTSFERFPLLSLSNELFNASSLSIFVNVLSALFKLSFMLAIPVVFVCFLIDIAFGLMNRIAPQINAYFLSMPVKMLGGLTMLFFVIPLVVDEFASHHQSISIFFHNLMAKP